MEVDAQVPRPQRRDQLRLSLRERLALALDAEADGRQIEAERAADLDDDPLRRQ
jgi:hypothetical protein